MVKITTHSEEETIEIGKKIANNLKIGDIVAMKGNLGAGKTTLTKSIAKNLDIQEYVTSPTFNIINEYYGKFPVYHFDVYRIENPEDIYELGFEEYFYGQGICIIEWADMIKHLIPEESIWIEIDYGKNETERIITIKGMDIETGEKI